MAEEGKKFDTGKAPIMVGCLQYFPRALSAVATISDYGFRKYGSWGGWRSVPDGLNRYTDALGRHLLAESVEGPYDDKESGCAHAAMVAWNALARLEKMLEDGVVEDRRGKEIVK